MKSYSDCYIAFIDILGFKEMVTNHSCNDIYDLYRRRMIKPMASFTHGEKPVLNMEDVHMKVMSDSVCFYIDCSIKNSLVGLVATCLYFQVDLLRYSIPILSRGAITCGKLFADGDIIFGPGFVKAYLMEEKSAKYPRIIMTRETIDTSIDLTDKEEQDYILSSSYLDYDEFYTLDCCELLEGFDTHGDECNNLLNYINNVLATSTDGAIREKFIYLKKHLLRWYKP